MDNTKLTFAQWFDKLAVNCLERLTYNPNLNNGPGKPKGGNMKGELNYRDKNAQLDNYEAGRTWQECAEEIYTEFLIANPDKTPK